MQNNLFFQLDSDTLKRYPYVIDEKPHELKKGFPNKTRTLNICFNPLISGLCSHNHTFL